EASGAGFCWGVLQSPPREVPFTTVDPSAIGQWLKAGSVEPPTGAQLAAWSEALELGRAPDDVWLVGGARLSRLPGVEGLSRVVVEEEVAPGVQRLVVEVKPAARPSRQVVLELPPAPQCVRLLRDPFGTAVAAPVLDTRPATVRAIRFSADGLRLLFAYGDGSVAAQALPQSPRATTPKPKRFLPAPGEHVVAMGWRRNGGLLTVTQLGDTLRVHGPLQGIPNGLPRVLSVPDGAAPPRLPRAGEPPLLVTSLFQRRRATPALVDGAGMLHGSEWHSGQLKLLPLHPVASVIEHRGALLCVGRSSREGARGPLTVWCHGYASASWSHESEVQGDGEAYLANVKDSGLVLPGPPLAVRQRPGTWRLLHNGHDPGMELSLPTGMRVVGLISWPAGTEWPALVTLAQDQRTFHRVTGSGAPELLMTAPARVVTATVSHALPMLAWLTEKGEVGVWSFQYRALVYRSTPGGSP
ncbi:MAG TPA: hypothetical protein VF794_24120, partial [Archangium sp.]|uniref:hypothetical protein n=1 Tax=Archangium sp. TaxID=1872627 RepID=UPI002EDA9C7E